jgi:hypothetical protein
MFVREEVGDRIAVELAHARAQALVREVNEQIHRLGGSGPDDLRALLCECCNIECIEQLSVPLDEYESVRRFPTRFILSHGHERSGDERVVERRAGYLVVEKLGAGARAAVHLDPRRRGS